MPDPQQPGLRAFISYSHRDERYRKDLEDHLALLRRQGMISVWHDRKIRAGQDFAREIDSELERADIVLLLVSARFIASDYCFGLEMTRAMERHDHEAAQVVPIILDHCDDWESTPFGKLTALPTDGKPISAWRPKSRAYADIVRGLRIICQDAARSRLDHPSPIARLPGKPRCFGREAEVGDLVATLLLEAPPPVPVLGPPGIGKSTVCLTALHDPRVAGRFGARRYFVRLDGARTAEAMLAAIAQDLAVPVGPNLPAHVVDALAAGPAALVLDNAETPWEGESAATEQALRDLAGIPGVALVAGVRGGQRPFGPAWRETIDIKPLGLEDARAAFLAVAGHKHAADPRLDDVITALDGVPLAIELMAHAAEAEPSLEGVWQRWQAERTAMLARGDGAAPQTSIAASLELSIAGPRMTEAARRLLSLLGVLPDGIAWDDLDALLPGAGPGAASVLRRVGLAFDESRRLRVLAPIREHVRACHPPDDDDQAHAVAHYAALAETLSDKVGAEGGAEAAQRLAGEAANIEVMLSRGLDADDPAPAIRAAIAFGWFQAIAGPGTTRLLERAQITATGCDDPGLAAWALERLGVIARSRCDNHTAKARLHKALTLFRRVGDMLGEAICIWRLGNIAWLRSDHDTARARYQQALPLFRRVGWILGEANCIKGLGDIALARSDHDTARDRYREAMPLYRRVGDVLGEASCILSFGDIADEQGNKGEAGRLYREALGLYGRIADPYSIGRAHHCLARITATEDERRAHLEAARARPGSPSAATI
jgi:tetratricopeptide (TPR) repeat protein